MHVRRNLIELFQYLDVFGWPHGFIAFVKVKAHATNQIRLKGIKHPIKLRSPSSDVNAFRQVFVYKEYDVEVKPDPDFIIDAGSNIGLAAIYFANRFPNATIVSVEPESKNFDLLKANTVHYEKIKPVQSGLWSHQTFLKVRDIGLGNWGFVVEEHATPDTETFEAISISDILKRFDKTEIDILKLDVEGAEKEIFTRGYQDWLPKTRILIIELHDRMKKGCSQTFFKALLEYDFLVSQSGENLICTRAS